jgi:hypothetical protein
MGNGTRTDANSLTLVALVYAFQTFSQGPYVAFATSSFRTHSQLATARVVQGVFAMTSFAFVSRGPCGHFQVADLTCRCPSFSTTSRAYPP